MVAILEKGEFNSDFHPMVDFIAASPLRYALTVKPTIFVCHIRQFWSTVRIETTDEGTHILATVEGIQRTVSESSLRRNLKLRDEDGIVSIPNTEFFENLTLMGYNIFQNQKLTFQKGQFSHQWKYLIHTIMQCLSPKSIGFNVFSSNIATALVCLATNRTYNFSKMIFDGMVKNVNNKISKFSMYPRQYSRRATIAQSSALPTVADEPASPVRDVSEGEACLTEYGFIVDQDRATIAKSSTLPHDSAPRVTSSATDEGSVPAKQSEDDAPIKGRSINEGETAAERISNNSEEIARVLTSMDAATVLAGEIDVPTGSGFIPTAGPLATVISTDSEIARDAEVARIHAEEEIQSQQRRPMTKKQKREYYMAMIKNNLGWKVKDFKGMTFEEIEAKFAEVWKHVEDFIPIGSKEEAERLKGKGLNLEQEHVKKQKHQRKLLRLKSLLKILLKRK
nr:synaptobrevin, longin-like domain protein [Tanacetum cinerariifolium]